MDSSSNDIAFNTEIAHCDTEVEKKSTVRSKTKKIEITMINTHQLAACKKLIQMSLQW
jgi:hypothetical protein